MIENNKYKSINLRLIILSFILLVLTIFWYLTIKYPENVREYKLYLTEKRNSLDFKYEELSEDWTEVDLKKYFSSFRFDCYDNPPGQFLGNRSCFTDIAGHNNSPAMTASFFFTNGKLSHASILIPWWHHSPMYQRLVKVYGKPDASEIFPSKGWRLYGWKLNNGGAIFYNKDRPLNILMYNSVFWMSPNQCKGQCIYKKNFSFGS